MRNVLGLSASFALLLFGAERVAAGDRETALATIDQAIKAHGGEAALARSQTLSRSSTGTINLFDKSTPFKSEMTVQLPERFRWDFTVGEGDQKLHVLFVVNGDRGWQSGGGAVTDIGKERLAEMREEAYVQWLTTLVPLKRDSGFELAPLAESKVDGQPAASVNAGRKGHADVKLYFDKKSGLLVKMERKAQEAGLTIDKEYLFSDHKNFDGVLLPVKTVELMNGKKFVEATGATYKLNANVDASVFAKP